MIVASHSIKVDFSQPPPPTERAAGHGAPRPALTASPHLPEVVLVPLVHHLRVASDTELWVVAVELLVAEVVEGREDAPVDLPVPPPQLPVEVWAALTGELAVEHEDVSAPPTVRTVDWRCCQRLD